LLALLVASCGGKTCRFDDSDFEWIPYKGNETLVFTSNTGDVDTLFLKNPNRYMDIRVDPLSTAPQDSIEKFYIPYYFSNDTATRFGEYPGETLIDMTKTPKGKTRIGFTVVTSDAFFYGLRYLDMKELRRAHLVELRIGDKPYQDILIIEPDSSNKKWSVRDHYVLKMYWSKSAGLVRYDKNNGVVYTLTTMRKNVLATYTARNYQIIFYSIS
jgi:hypothetical protein